MFTLGCFTGAVISRVDSEQLDVEEERLVNEPLVLEHEAERALAREGGGFGVGLLPVVVGVANGRWHDDAANGPYLHPHNRLVEGRNDLQEKKQGAGVSVTGPSSCKGSEGGGLRRQSRCVWRSSGKISEYGYHPSPVLMG